MAWIGKRLRLGLVLLFGISRALAQEVAPESNAAAELRETSFETAPVILDGVPLFDVAGITTFPAARRAETIADRIQDLARDRAFDPATLAILGSDSELRIGTEGRPLFRVTSADAEVQRLDQRLVAELCLARTREAIVAYRAARTREALASAAWRAAIASAVALLAFLALRFMFRRLNLWIERRYASRVKSVTIRSFELLGAGRILLIVRGVFRAAGTITLMAVAVLYLRYALALFPWTRAAALQIDDWILGPLAVLGSGFVAKIPNLVFLAVLFVVVRYALSLIHLFFAAVGREEVTIHEFEPEWAEPTYKIVRAVLVAFALIVAYPYIPGSSTEAFKGVSLFVGVLFSLGSSSTISNLIAGYVMIYRRAFREGDLVKIGGELGFVSRVRLQVTHLRTSKNVDIVIPNSSILAGEVMNYTSLAKSHGLILHTTVGIGYETPWRQVEAMLLDAAARTEGLRPAPEPFVL